MRTRSALRRGDRYGRDGDVAEPEPCVFTRTDIVPGEPVVTLRFDLNRARAVELLDSSGSFDTLNIITVQFVGRRATLRG